MVAHEKRRFHNSWDECKELAEVPRALFPHHGIASRKRVSRTVDGGAVRPARILAYAARKPLDGIGAGTTVTAPLRISPSGLPSGRSERPKKLFRKIAPAA
jgi:hypothetical protein